jgi:hypothetical protein
VLFAYDYMGRRVQKRVETWDPNGLDWDFKSARRFVWYNWFMIEELADSGRGLQLDAHSGAVSRIWLRQRHGLS